MAHRYRRQSGRHPPNPTAAGTSTSPPPTSPPPTSLPPTSPPPRPAQRLAAPGEPSGRSSAGTAFAASVPADVLQASVAAAGAVPVAVPVPGGPVGRVATAPTAEALAAPGEAATTIGRAFRPDVEGLRAVAVALVVLYHAHVPGVSGGFVGVDVFFVISGFLITGLLVREGERRGSVSILGFYARRARRILPASAVVVLFTLFASYRWLGFLTGNAVAQGAAWTSVFMANIHFALVGTSYFGSQQAPSPLLHMWSLGVEEQFYVVWPGLFLLVSLVAARRVNRRAALAATLGAIVVASLAWSVVETSTSATWAYFSPLTRAWELAAGGLLAVSAPAISRFPRRAAVAMGLGGAALIAFSTVRLSPLTLYPGSAAVYPVAGAALLIAAGTAAAGLPAERVLALRPMQWLGARSYSLYLWHWPLLIIATEYAGHALSVTDNLGWAAVAVLAAALSFRLVERPIRRSPLLARRATLSVAMGIGIVGLCMAIAQWQLHTH